MDFNLPPLNFTFVRDRFAGKGVHISDDTIIGKKLMIKCLSIRVFFRYLPCLDYRELLFVAHST